MNEKGLLGSATQGSRLGWATCGELWLLILAIIYLTSLALAAILVAGLVGLSVYKNGLPKWLISPSRMSRRWNDYRRTGFGSHEETIPRVMPLVMWPNVGKTQIHPDCAESWRVGFAIFNKNSEVKLSRLPGEDHIGRLVDLLVFRRESAKRQLLASRCHYGRIAINVQRWRTSEILNRELNVTLYPWSNWRLGIPDVFEIPTNSKTVLLNSKPWRVLPLGYVGRTLRFGSESVSGSDLSVGGFDQIPEFCYLISGVLRLSSSVASKCMGLVDELASLARGGNVIVFGFGEKGLGKIVGPMSLTGVPNKGNQGEYFYPRLGVNYRSSEVFSDVRPKLLETLPDSVSTVVKCAKIALFGIGAIAFFVFAVAVIQGVLPQATGNEVWGWAMTAIVSLLIGISFTAAAYYAFFPQHLDSQNEVKFPSRVAPVRLVQISAPRGSSAWHS